MGVRVIRFARISPQCKGGAVLVELYSGFPSAPSGTLTMLRLASPL